MFLIILELVMSWDVDKNMTKIYNYNNSNSSSNSRYSKLISLSINNRSSHSKQITKAIIIIQHIFNNSKIGDILSILFGWKME